MDRVRGECGEADRNVFGAAFVGSGVADPFTRVHDDGLSGGDVERPTLVFNPKHALQDDGALVEGRSLARFQPSGGAAHVGHAGGRGLGVDASDVFVDEFGLVAGGLDAGGLRDQRGHGSIKACPLSVEEASQSASLRSAGQPGWLSHAGSIADYGQGCGVGGVAGMPGMWTDGVPGESPMAGVPGISMSGVPGMPGV